jgi:hypothetical protein
MRFILLIALSVIPLAAQSVDEKQAMEAFILNETGQSSVVPDHKCGTRYEVMIHAHPEYITPALREAYLRIVSAEPVRQKSVLSPSGYFMLHYDESGSQAVPPGDLSANGLPDYIDSAAVIFEYVRHRQIDEMGYQAPPAQDGNPAIPYHVYFSELNYYGITTPVYMDIDPLPGLNYPSYIQVDNDYQGFPTDGLAGLKVTAAHEFHHAVQLGYNINWDDIYFFEMTSTWMEEMLYPAIDDYLNYLGEFFNSVSNTRFTLASGFYPYANSLYLQMLTALYGEEIVKRIWDNIRSESSLSAIRSALTEQNDSWPASLGEYGLWLFYTGGRSLPGTFFSDAEFFPQIRITSADKLRFDEKFSGEIVVDENASRYMEFAPVAGNVLNIDAVTDSKAAGYRSMTRFSYSPFYPANSPLLNQMIDADTLVVALTNGSDYPQATLLSLSVAGNISLTDIYPFPNPANANEIQIIRFQNVPASASLFIFNLTGDRIATVDAEGASAVRTWNLTNNKGDRIHAGIYIYLLQDEGNTQTGKISVLR